MDSPKSENQVEMTPRGTQAGEHVHHSQHEEEPQGLEHGYAHTASVRIQLLIHGPMSTYIQTYLSNIQSNFTQSHHTTHSITQPIPSHNPLHHTITYQRALHVSSHKDPA